jgi:hypothetical protein
MELAFVVAVKLTLLTITPLARRSLTSRMWKPAGQLSRWDREQRLGLELVAEAD